MGELQAIEGRSGELMVWQLSRGEADAAEQWTGTPTQRTLVNAPDLLLRMACAGAGITVVSDQFAWGYLERGELLRILQD